MRDRKKLLSIILVFAMVLQMAFPTYADTRTVRRTLTKTTTTYTTQKIKLKKKASKTYSVVGKTVTYVSYRTKDSNPVKTTKKITPTLKQIISKEYRSDGERYPYLRMDDLRSLIWETQLKTVFPVIERYRSYFIKKYSSYIQKALPPSAIPTGRISFPRKTWRSEC